MTKKSRADPASAGTAASGAAADGTPSLQIALLRGVNVGGVTVKSAALAEAFRGLGLADVRTVLASGNVLFSGDGSAEELTGAIEKALSDAFGYSARVILTDQATVRSVIDAYPFEEVADRQPYVVFVAQPGDIRSLLDLAGDLDRNVERVEAGDGVLYWEVKKGMSTDSAFSKRTARTPGILTTTRNLRTLRKLL